MSLPTFLLFLLVFHLHLLHLAKATTCQGDNCQLVIIIWRAYNWAHCSNWFNDNLPFVVCITYSFPIAGLVITGGSGGDGTKTSIETFPEADCSIPPFPGKGNLSSSPDYQPFIHSPLKGDGCTPSLSSPKENNLWLVAAPRPRRHASLGGMVKRTGKTSTHWGEIHI